MTCIGIKMKTFITILAVCFLLPAFGANPTFNSFNTDHFVADAGANTIRANTNNTNPNSLVSQTQMVQQVGSQLLQSNYATLAQIGGSNFFQFNARVKLTNDLTLGVSTTGSDNNNGITAPFLTLQAAMDKAISYDLGTNNITLQCSNGTYSGSVLCRQMVSSTDWKKATGVIIIHGNDSTPSSVTITNASTNHLILATLGSRLSVRSVTLGAANRADADLFDSQMFSTLDVSNVVMGPCGSSAIQVVCETSAMFYNSGAYTITGGGLAHYAAQSGGSIWITQPITLTGTPAYTLAFMQAYGGGAVMFVNGGSFTGSATGIKYQVMRGGSFTSFGLTNADGLFPGSINGIQDLQLAEGSAQPFTATNGVYGLTNEALPGVVGEYTNRVVNFGGRVFLSSNVVASVTSFTLTPGDWDVEAQATFTTSGSVVIQETANISAQTAALAGTGIQIFGSYTNGVGADTLTIPRFRLLTATNCPVFLTVNLQFINGAPAAYGNMSARRMR